MSTANAEADVGDTLAGTVPYCLKRSRKLSTGDNMMSRSVNEEGAPFDSGFDDTGPFRVSPVSGSVSLEAALRDFGPAAIDDLITRVGALAATLDRAHAGGAIHGALHPRNIFVTDTATHIVLDNRPSAPYAAPEVLSGGAATAASDQFSLAAIAHEWMTGRPIGGPADRPIDVRAMPGVDRAAMSRALTRALARESARRFVSCSAFRDALMVAVASSLPLLGDDDPVEPFVPETPGDDAELAITPTNGPSAAPAALEDFEIRDPDASGIGDQGSGIGDQGSGIRDQGLGIGQGPGIEVHGSGLRDLSAEVDDPGDTPVPVRAWEPSMSPARDSMSPRFGGFALILAALVGAVFGFAAGYMARPRALQTAPIAEGLAPEAGAAGATSVRRRQVQQVQLVQQVRQVLRERVLRVRAAPLVHRLRARPAHALHPPHPSHARHLPHPLHPPHPEGY